MINIQDLNFSYSKRTELITNLSLQLEAGRIHGLLGKNGEGKSTLLKLMSGLVFPQPVSYTHLDVYKRQVEISCL